MVVLVVTTHPNMWFWKYWDCIPDTIPGLGGQVVCFWVVKIGHLDKFSAVGFLILTYQFHIYQHKKSTAVCGDHLSRCWQSSLYCSLTLRSPPKSHVLHVLPCPASAMGAPRQSPWIPKRRPGSTPVGAFSMQQSLQESETRHLLGLFHQPGWLLGLIFVQKCYPKKFNWLVVYLPLWKIWKPVGIMIPNIWTIKNVPNHQPVNNAYCDWTNVLPHVQTIPIWSTVPSPFGQTIPMRVSIEWGYP